LNFSTLEIALLAFFIGIFTGFLVALIIIKVAISKQIKSVYTTLNNLLLFKLKHQKELKKRSEALHIISSKLQNLKSEFSKPGSTDYTHYIDDLNQILSERGISKIPKSKKN